jgi:hypothetical protein
MWGEPRRALQRTEAASVRYAGQLFRAAAAMRAIIATIVAPDGRKSDAGYKLSYHRGCRRL